MLFISPYFALQNYCFFCIYANFDKLFLFLFLFFLHTSQILCTFALAKVMKEMDYEHWHWQEPGEAWRGVGIYHVTLTVPNRQPLLGELVIPNNDPKLAYVKASSLGLALLDCLKLLPTFQPEIQVLQYCLMPDHLHTIWYVRKTMKTSIRYAAQGFARAAKKIGRAYSYIRLLGGTTNESDITSEEENFLSSIVSAMSREDPLRKKIGGEAYGQLPPLFTERPFIRPLSRHGQLQSMIRYVQMNPQRLATKRLKPGFFCVQPDILIAGRTYSAVGNIALLHYNRYSPVHVRSIWVKDAEQHGYDQPLRDYKNGCVIAARQGTVMISPFISQHEQEVLHVLLKEKHPIIYIADNGFGQYFKPSDLLFDAVAEGRLLILSPWPYDPDKHHVTRPDCIAMNQMAEDICAALH